MRKKKVITGIIAGLVILLAAASLYTANLAAFPGRIRDGEYTVEVDGVRSTFERGVAYRYPGLVPLVEVSGSHYEMGLQYGVLLRPEILEALKSYENIVRWNAGDMGIPYFAMMAVLKFKAKQMARDLPERFLDEVRGISDGSGVPVDTILAITLFYDIGEGLNCTSVLMRGADGAIIHGRNQDTSQFGGEEISGLTVVVRYNADGYNSVTHTDWVLFMGVETGYNDRGLAFSEETLRIREPNPAGFSLVYLVRMALEECSTLEELYPLFDRYGTVGAYGTAWSDRHSGEGVVAELTPTEWALIEMDGPILWNFNHFYDPGLRARQQHPGTGLAGRSQDREEIAAVFPLQSEYTVEDAVAFLRGTTGPDGTDYSKYASRRSVSNYSSSQMVVFDPRGDGLYLAVGPYFAAYQDVYRIYEDFSRPPELFMAAVPLDPVVEETARIKNMLISRSARVDAHAALADRFPGDAYAQFKAAYNAFLTSRVDVFAEYAEKAYRLDPSVDEHKLYAGMAAYHRGLTDQAAALLEEIDPAKLHPEQEAFRLAVLERCAGPADSALAGRYAAQREALLKEYDAVDYFSGQLRRIDALRK